MADVAGGATVDVIAFGDNDDVDDADDVHPLYASAIELPIVV